MITASLVVLAILAHLGKSLVMLASVGGIALALWLTRGQSVRKQVLGATAGAVGGSVAAELVHLIYHATGAGAIGHGGFWVSAVLVGLINAVVVAPVIWADSARLRRQRVGAPDSPTVD